MGILFWILAGLIAGGVASLLVRARGYGIAGGIIIGIVGALLGGFLSWLLFGINPMSGFDVISTVVAFVGAVALIAIFRYL